MSTTRRRTMTTTSSASVNWEDMYRQVLMNTATSVVVPEGVTKLRYRMFCSATNMTDITLPSTLASINGTYVFEGCTSLTHVYYNNSTTALAQGTFSGCNAITDIANVIPSGATVIANEQFRGCNGLTDVVVPEGIQRCEIGWIYGSNIVSITYPTTITSISNVSGSLNLSNINYMACLATTPPGISVNAFGSATSYSFPIYVPDAVVSTYKTASTYWQNYASRIQGISNLTT